MQSPCIDACNSFRNLVLCPRKLLYLHAQTSTSRTISCNFKNRDSKGEVMKVKGKETVWSIDNKRAEVEEEGLRKLRRRRGGGGRRARDVAKKRKGDKAMVSATMLMEVEKVLRTQEPIIRPAWNTFASGVTGIWKGVGAVFSPINAEMEPIDIGSKNENLFDCYTLSRVEVVPTPVGSKSQVKRSIKWATLNPYGEVQQLDGDASVSEKQSSKGKLANNILPKFESFNLGRSDLMEEDLMGIELGLVYFEDGSYSRGRVDIPVGEFDESKYFLSPTLKFEQCLVKGCHKRLRVVHTVEFSNGGSDIQILRVAVYEEQWVSPANFPEQSDVELDMKLFSQRQRVQPSELSGSWEVFEVSATPIYDEEMMPEESDCDRAGPPYVCLCMENLKKRSMPENPVYFTEEEIRDMQDVTVLWLPGGVTAYVDVKKDGILCLGVGWYSDEGVNLVMERDYGLDGKLKEVRWKTEVKRR